MCSSRIRLALACAILLCGLSLPAATKGSLAAYTETRSFRDALDGRSMEDALSGPVDKDTSSYGERTGGGLSSMGMGSTRGIQASPMMLNIPANGNLMGVNGEQQQEDQQQQQKSTGGSELERETSPEAEDAPMDSQQKMLEPTLPMQATLMEMNARQQQKMMMMKNIRQQQQQQEQESTTETSQNGAAKGQAEQGFGEEQSMGPATAAKGGPNRTQEQAKSPSTGNGQKYSQDEQQKQVGDSNGSQDEQQVVAFGGKSSSTEMSAEQLAKQRMMAAMLMTMSKAMNYQNSLTPVSMQNSQTGYGNGGSMKVGGMKKMNADNMLMSMVNMKPMMNSATAGPMMMDAISPYKPSGQSGNYNGYSNVRGGMRRANQRKPIARKMSPAMVNTLLNKMMNSSNNNKASYSSDSMDATKPDAMAMLMKTAAGAELLTNMVASQNPMMNGASPAARDQYKRMMMAAIMKQAAGPSNSASLASYGMSTDGMRGGYSAGSNRQERLNDSQRYQPSAKSAATARGYGPSMGAAPAPVVSQLAMMINMMNAQKAVSSPISQMSMDQQQEQQTSVNDSPSYTSNRASGSMRTKTSGYERPQMMEQQQMMNSGNAQSGFGEDSQVGTKSARQMPNKLAMMMSNGAAARGAAMNNRYSPSMSSNKQTGSDNNVQQKYKDRSYMSTGDMIQQQQQTSLDTPTKGSMRDTDLPMIPTMASVPRPTMPSPPMMSNSMRPIPSYQSAKPLGAGVKGDQQQKDDFDQTPAPMQTMSYGNTGNENNSQQQQLDNGLDDQVKGQQQVDENGAAPKGMAEPFAFDYKVEDDYGNEHYRKEESDKNGAVRGSYGYMDNNGLYRHVEYVADENGFRANVKSNEPGLSSDSPKLSPSTPTAGSIMGSSQMARPAAMSSTTQDSSPVNSQMMSQMLDVAQMMVANDGNQQQQQQQQIPASQTELNAEETRRRA